MSDDKSIQLAISDVHIVANALGELIKKKAFTEEEIKGIFSPWSRVIRFCEDIKRKSDIENLYKKEESKIEEEVDE